MRAYIALTVVTGLLIPSAAHAAGGYDLNMGGQPSQIVQVVAGEKVNDGARDFIDSMGKQAISFLGNESYSQAQKEAEFRRLLKNSFDMKTIGRFALGRYWSTATAQQQQEYLRLFEDMVVGVYAQRFNEYKGQALDVTSYRPDGDKDTLVTSYIVDPNGTGKFQVDWRVRSKAGSYKIVDVIIEGVSMSLTQRSDFSSVIQRGGGDVQSLLVHLRGQQ
jgi:phospholipid transport system substrate-binding protein